MDIRPSERRVDPLRVAQEPYDIYRCLIPQGMENL